MMEISNSLKAELDKIVQPLFAPASPPTGGSPSRQPAAAPPAAEPAPAVPLETHAAATQSGAPGSSGGAFSVSFESRGEPAEAPESVRKRLAPVEEQLELAGRQAPQTSEPPVTRPPEMTRGTQSQRARLRALSRKKEEKPKVANYNLLKE